MNRWTLLTIVAFLTIGMIVGKTFGGLLLRNQIAIPARQEKVNCSPCAAAGAAEKPERVDCSKGFTCPVYLYMQHPTYWSFYALSCNAPNSPSPCLFDAPVNTAVATNACGTADCDGCSSAKYRGDSKKHHKDMSKGIDKGPQKDAILSNGAKAINRNRAKGETVHVKGSGGTDVYLQLFQLEVTDNMPIHRIGGEIDKPSTFEEAKDLKSVDGHVCTVTYDSEEYTVFLAKGTTPP